MPLLLLTALTMLAFAGNSILNRLAVGGGEIGAMRFVLVRLVAGAALLAALVLARRLAGGRPLWPGLRGRIGGVGGLLVYLFGFSAAYVALDAGTGALILFGTVQITLFGAALVLGERVPARRWAGAALAFAGLVLLLAPGIGQAPSPPHAALMVAAGIGWGLYTMSARGTPDPLAATAWNFLLAVPFALAASAILADGPAAAPVTVTGYALAATSGAITSGLGYALWYRVLPALGPSRAAVAQLTVPLIAAAGGAALIGEPVGLRFALASALVLGGVAWALARPGH